VLVFNDPAQALINGKEFQSGTPVKVEIGFGSKLKRVFEGEVARNSTGAGMQPDQYHDGTNWVALPAGFRPGAADYFSIAFYKDGSTYKVPGAAALRYPDAFADYEFDSETYTNIRAGWAQRVHDTWSTRPR
jgi:hypothetical protein